MTVIPTYKPSNPLADPDLRTLSSNLTLPNSAKFLQRINATSAGVVVTVPDRMTVRFVNTGTIAFAVALSNFSNQTVVPGEQLDASWDIETGIHVLSSSVSDTIQSDPDLLTLSGDVSLTSSSKYRQIVTASGAGHTLTIPATQSHEIFNAGTESFDLEVVGLSTQVVLAGETIEATWDNSGGAHVLTSQIDATETPDGTVRRINADGSLTKFESDGTINGNGAALVAALTSIVAPGTGVRVYADPEATYAVPNVTTLTGLKDVKIIGNGAKIQPRADITYSNLFWVTSCDQVVFVNFDFDGLSENYDRWEIPLDPEFEWRAGFISKNQNLSAQGTTSDKGGRFITFSACTNSGVEGCYFKQNSTSFADNGFTETMWSADAVFYLNGANNFARRSYFYRCGYAGIHCESAHFVAEDISLHNVMWHGIVANSNAAGHRITLNRIHVVCDTERFTPTCGGIDVNTIPSRAYERVNVNGLTVECLGYMPGGKAWAAGESVTVGTFRYNASSWYRASTAGTTAVAAPTHTTGNSADGGGVGWEYISPYSGMNPVKFGGSRHTFLTDIHVKQGYSALGGVVRGLAFQDSGEVLVISNSSFSHAIQSLTLDKPLRKFSVTGSTIAYGQPEGFATWFEAQSTTIEDCELHYSSRAIANKGSTDASKVWNVNKNVFVPSQTAGSQVFYATDMLAAMRAGNFTFRDNQLYDSVGDAFYDANDGFAGTYYNRSADLTEARLLLSQINGGLLYDPSKSGVYNHPSSQSSAPWFNSGSLLISGSPGMVIRNADYNAAGSGAQLVPQWQWDATGGGWSAP